MARRDVMERRHFDHVAECINGVLLNTPEPDRPVALRTLESLAIALAASNDHMNMSRFLNDAGIPNSSAVTDTGGGGSHRRGGVEGLAAHKRL